MECRKRVESIERIVPFVAIDVFGSVVDAVHGSVVVLQAEATLQMVDEREKL